MSDDPFRYTICVDFDGVLHQYDGDWQGHHVIPGDACPGAIEWLEEITQGFEVAILSTRGSTIDGLSAILDWVAERCSPNVMEHLRVVSIKPPALLYVDDRAWRFDGTNWPSKGDVHNALPWWKTA